MRDFAQNPTLIVIPARNFETMAPPIANVAFCSDHLGRIRARARLPKGLIVQRPVLVEHLDFSTPTARGSDTTGIELVLMNSVRVSSNPEVVVLDIGIVRTKREELWGVAAARCQLILRASSMEPLVERAALKATPDSVPPILTVLVGFADVLLVRPARRG
jgi:hypothetical protein